MSKPKNGAARNIMTKLERKCYDWGWSDAEERIIEIIKKRRDYDCRCKCECHAEPAPCIYCQADNELIETIKGEK